MLAPHRRRYFHGAAVALSLMLLVACASNAPPKLDESKVRAFTEKGYLTVDRYAITTMLATWTRDGKSIEIALSAPTKRGQFPLVVYLPGLGETRVAGEVWRTAWAKAGYAVLSLQPLSDDSDVWSSAQARAGDFSDLARERYSSNVMAARIEALRYVLSEVIRKRGETGGLFDQVDPARTAIAGYDLGAYVAMLIAGEKKHNIAPPDLPVKVAAVIALSPFADSSGKASADRYSDIHGPVISITSDADTDPLGLVSPASARKLPFEYMPGGGKYLLSLSNASHRTLAGNALSAEVDQQESDSRKSGPGGGQRKRGKNPDGSDAGLQGGNYLGGVSIGSRISPTELAIAAAAVEGVTTAFLDAFLNNDPIAREWLRKDAARWLAPAGELEIK